MGAAVRPGALLVLLSIAACGSDECVRVNVDTSAFAVPEELDTLHFRLLDLRGLFTERSYELTDGEASVELCRGERTSRTVRLIVLGLSGGTVISSAPEVAIDFEDGPDTVEVVLAP
jgi:hypothetical protein